MRIRELCIYILLASATAAWTACGGGPSSSSTSPTAPAPTATTTSGGAALTAPKSISVANGQATSGVNIVVPGTASAFNVQMLGVNSPSATRGSASNVGGAVARGTTAVILIFGAGLTGSETIGVSGPNDISISGEQGVTATDGTKGIQFTITVGGNAAVGARTLNVTSGNNASTFVGGLEVF